MYPSSEQYRVIVEGIAYQADLETLKQWVREGRIGAYTLVTKENGSSMAARETPELREFFQPARLTPPPSPVAPPPRANVPVTPASPVAPGYPARPYSPSAQVPLVPFRVSAHDGPFPNATQKKHPRYRSAILRVWGISIPCLAISVLVMFSSLVAPLGNASNVSLPGDVTVRMVVVAIALLFFGLNLGLHFKSRLCGVVLFLWMVVASGANFFFNPAPEAVVVTLFLGILYFIAMTGTFSYHSFRNDVETGLI